MPPRTGGALGNTLGPGAYSAGRPIGKLFIRTWTDIIKPSFSGLKGADRAVDQGLVPYVNGVTTSRQYRGDDHGQPKNRESDRHVLTYSFHRNRE